MKKILSILFFIAFCLATPAMATVSVYKFYDANANGENDDEVLIDGWKVSIAGDDFFTPVSGLELPAGTFTVYEYDQANWRSTTPEHVDVSPAGPDVVIEFGNLCLGPGGGLAPGFWSSKNGEKLTGSDDIAMLKALYLKDARGRDFDPARYSMLKTWLQGSEASDNMAYKLSSQLAAMELNVFNGKVNGGALIYAPRTAGANAIGFAPVNTVMAEANAELRLHPLTRAGNQFRAYQEALKDALAGANNNLNFVQPSSGQCTCSSDADSDGALDCFDGCPSDPAKTVPGACGCGTADTDTDGDGTPDCQDACPSDPTKIAAGTCGCGVADTDSDGDQTANCNDGCPGDPARLCREPAGAVLRIPTPTVIALPTARMPVLWIRQRSQLAPAGAV